MAWQTRVLVVANRTADSDELRAALEERAKQGPMAFTLLVPAGPGSREYGRDQLDRALEKLRAAGLEVEGVVGNDPDPFVDVSELWDPRSYDEVIVSTLPTGPSRWLQMDLPRRVAKLTDAPVRHVVAAATRAPEPATSPPPETHSGVKDTSDFIAHFFGSTTEGGKRAV